MKPILFNTEMVRAILDGRKSATRRIIKKQPKEKNDIIYKHSCGKWYISPDNDSLLETEIKPPYLSGDILYVRETWAEVETVNGVPYYIFKADDQNGLHSTRQNFYRWYPSIHMLKEAARLFLRVTDVRVERLQDITEEQAAQEGAPKAFEYNTPEGSVITLDEGGYFRLGFKALWNSTIWKDKLPIHGWDANPWVWVIEFERIEKSKEAE